MARILSNGIDVIVVYGENEKNEESIPVGVFNEMYGRDLLEEIKWKKEQEETKEKWLEWAEKIIEYYDIFEALVRACGDFVNTEKFRKNLYRHWGERSWSPILEVRKDYPNHGDVRQLNSKAESIDALLIKLNDSAVKIGLPKATKKELKKLRDDILECDTNKRQKKYYRRIKRYRSSFEIHSLQEWIDDDDIIDI